MKRIILNIFLVALVSSLMVACSKEEVKPYSNPASGQSVMQLRDGDENTTTTDVEDTDVASPADGEGADVIESEDEDGSITDGGNSADYDTKGHKKKKTN